MMKNKNKSFLGFFCFLTLSLTACEAKEPAASSPYPVYDSEAWADPFGSADLYWLDNNRVIFRSVQDNDKRRITSGPFNLSIWEIGKGVSIYAKNVATVQGLLGRFCYNSDGMIFYPLAEKDAQGNDQYKYGEFGKEKLFTRPKDAKTILEQMNCRVLDVDTMMKERKGRAIIPLLDRHGYLDRGAVHGKESLKKVPTILYRPGHPEGLALPVIIAYVNYYAFQDAYLFRGGFSPDAPMEFRSLWPPGTQPGEVRGWLHPDGRIEPLIIPAEWPDKKVPPGYYPIPPLREGYLIVHGEAKGPRDPGPHGGYYLRGNKLVKVIGGYLKSLTISPDGCKVAFVHYPYSDATIVHDPAPIRLKAVDLCPNKEEKPHAQ
jgi:hypothetical protein